MRIGMVVATCIAFNILLSGGVSSIIAESNIKTNRNSSVEKSIANEPLKGIKILIDAGHQSKGNFEKEKVSPSSNETKAKVSAGTKGVHTGKMEYALNLEVALKLKSSLQKQGAEVLMIRETNDVDVSNKERATIANDNKVNFVIRLHADGSENKNVSGYSILIPGLKGLPNKNIVATSKNLASSILESMEKNLTTKSRGIIERNDLTGFNWLKVPGVLVEMGFMTNADEDKKLSTEEYQNEIVSAITKGIVNFYSK